MIYFTILFSFFSFSSQAQDFVNSINNSPDARYHIVEENENIRQIARHYDLGYNEIRNANPEIKDDNIIYVGQKIILPVVHLIPDEKKEGIVINLAEFRLYFFDKEDNVRSFPISIGSDEKTPIGTTKIINKKKDPSWRPPLFYKITKPQLPDVVPPGPDNPLGKYALYLDHKKDKKWESIAIHGTDNPSSIGTRVSLGCIRLYPQDIEELYSSVEIGTKVNIINEDLKVKKVGDKIYLETHFKNQPDLITESFTIKKRICDKISNCEEKINWDKVDEIVFYNLGIPEVISY